MSVVLTPPVTSAPQEQWVALQTGQIVVSAAISVPNASYMEYNVAEQVTGIVGGADGLIVFLLGTKTELDGGQGWFAWDSTNLTPPDGLTVFNPYASNSTPGRWLLATVVLNVDEALAQKMHWVPYTTLGQAFVTNDVTRDGEWTMIANKSTTTRPAPQETGPETDLLPEWTPATQSARASYTVLNQWTLSQAGWISQYGIDILGGNVGMTHAVTLTINGTVQDTFSITPTVTETYFLDIAPILLTSPGAVVQVKLTVTQTANNLVYWEQETGLFATAPTYTSLAQGQKDGAALGTTAYGCHATFVPGTASPDWDVVAYSGGASGGGGSVGLYLPLTGGTINPGPLVVTANAAVLPAPFTGMMLQIGNVDASNTAVEIDCFGSGTAPEVNFVGSGGTAAAPTAVPDNTFLGALNFGGYDGSSIDVGAQITSTPINANWSSSDHGAQITFNTAAAGSTSVQTRMTLRQGLTLGTPFGDPGFGSLVINANAAALPAGPGGTRVPAIHAGGLDGNNTAILLEAFGNPVGPVFDFRTSRGTASAPTATQQNDILGFVEWYARGASQWNLAATFSAVALENYTDSVAGSVIGFNTCAVGTATLTTRMLIYQGVVIGNANTDPGQGSLVLNANAAVLPPPGRASAGLQIGAADGQYLSPTFDAFAAYTQLFFRRADGSNASKTALVANDVIASLDFQGWNGSAYVDSAVAINLVATQNWTTGVSGTAMLVYTTANGTNVATNTLTLDGSGDLTITGATATKPGGGSWTAPSDRTLKSSVTEWNTGLAEVLRLRPVSYQYNNDQWNLGHCDYVGLDAEDGADVIPEMSRTVTLPVGPAPAEGEAQQTTQAAALDHGPLLFALVNAVKELTARLEALEGAK